MTNKLALTDLLNRTTLEVSDPAEISMDRLADVLNEYSFAMIRGVIDGEVILEAKRRLAERYNPDNDSPAMGEHPKDIMGNFQKLSIGGAEHSGVYRPRCMRTYYNPIWADDIYGLRESFRKCAQIRNIMYGFDVNFAIDTVEDGFWTAARIHSYPAGGGFLVSHLDDVVPVVQRAEGLSRYFQPVIVMSRKGTDPDCDFETGGGFFELNSHRYYYEEACELGDVVIYSGATQHGVADIDLHRTFDSRRPEGRYSGFVTLYKEFTGRHELADYVPPPENQTAI